MACIVLCGSLSQSESLHLKFMRSHLHTVLLLFISETWPHYNWQKMSISLLRGVCRHICVVVQTGFQKKIKKWMSTPWTCPMNRIMLNILFTIEKTLKITEKNLVVATSYQRYQHKEHCEPFPSCLINQKYWGLLENFWLYLCFWNLASYCVRISSFCKAVSVRWTRHF